jgi:tetratricopeptide (TPR) repeat protein
LEEREVVREQQRLAVQAALAADAVDQALEICRSAGEAEDDPVLQTFYAVALHRSGRTEDGIARISDLVADDPNFAAGYANLGELQRRAGAFDAAIVSLERACALDPENPLVHFNLGRTHQDAGDDERAAAAYRAALKADHRFLPAYRGLVRVLKDLVQPGEAELENRCLQLAELRAPAAADPDHAFRLRSALQGARRAVRFRASHPDAVLVMGKLLVDVEEFALAVSALAPLVKQAEPDPDVFVALSMAYAGQKKWREARAATVAFARAHPIGTRKSAKAEADVLVLEALYNPAFERPGGGIEASSYGSAAYARRGVISGLLPERLTYHHCYIDEIDPAAPGFAQNFDVIYNNIGFAEVNLRRNYKDAVELIAQATGLEMVNRPEAVDGASRSANYQALRGLDQAIFPKTLSYPVNAVEIEGSIKNIEHEFTFPVLVRSRIHSSARAFFRADDITGLREAIKRIDPRGAEPVYVIQYHESRHRSGAFLRYRLVFVDGVLYPGVISLSDGWRQGWQEAAAWAGKLGSEFIEEERRWLDEPEAVIGGENLAALGQAQARIGLDVLGMDIGLAEDGKVIIYEANGETNVLGLPRPADTAPHFVAASRRIQTAIEDLILKKSGAAAATV